MPSTYVMPGSTHFEPTASHVVHSTQTTLKFLYGLLPIAAGADKFTNFLTHWEQYLNPRVLDLVPVTASAFMRAVGVIEIIAGILVFAKPRVGATIVALWLLGIALQLLVGWMYLDIAVRDIAMAIGAFTLVRLSGLVHGATTVTAPTP